jgi:hypothetical protein
MGVVGMIVADAGAVKTNAAPTATSSVKKTRMRSTISLCFGRH